MMVLIMNRLRFLFGIALPLMLFARASAWDEPGHVTVTKIALDSLPAEFPAWVLTPESRARLCYLAAEPDRWRGQGAHVLDHVNAPDHYLDVEDLDTFRLKIDNLPRFRNEFVEMLAAQRALHPERFPKLNGSADKDHTHTVPGMLPYAIEELRWRSARAGQRWIRLRPARMSQPRPSWPLREMTSCNIWAC